MIEVIVNAEREFSWWNGVGWENTVISLHLKVHSLLHHVLRLQITISIGEMLEGNI